MISARRAKELALENKYCPSEAVGVFIRYAERKILLFSKLHKTDMILVVPPFLQSAPPYDPQVLVEIGIPILRRYGYYVRSVPSMKCTIYVSWD